MSLKVSVFVLFFHYIAKFIKKISILYLLLFSTIQAYCQSDTLKNKPRYTNLNYTTNSLIISYGNLYLTDNYISLLPYLGWNIMLEGTHKGFFKDYRKLPLYWKIQNSFIYGNAINLPATALMSFMSGETGLGLGYLWLKRDFKLEVGGISSFLLASKYNSRNINNFQSFDIILNNYIDIEASYKFNFKKVSLKLSENIQVPIIGGMFIPEYGAIYYEYYLGDKKNASHFYSFHNKIGVKNRFEFSIAIKRIILNIQYFINYQKWNANSLYFSQLQHNIGIGMTFYLHNVTDR